MTDIKLGERAILMRLSIGMPGEQRQDPALSSNVKREHGLGQQAGRWVKALYPPEALAPIKKLDNEARAYHGAVTLPFDQGIGILPAALIKEHGDRMREFAGRRAHLIASHFMAKAEDWITWAQKEHNGTFDPDLYPGCSRQPDGSITFDKAEFNAAMAESFTFRTEPLPVPNAQHFADTVASLLGTDLESVNLRVADAAQEAQRQLMKRLIQPVQHMASKLAGTVCQCSNCRGKQGASDKFKDTLTANLKEIAELAPKLNLSGDPQIDRFAAEIKGLSQYNPEVLRDSPNTRDEAKAKAAELFGRLSGYKI